MKILQKTFSRDETCLFGMRAASLTAVFEQTIDHLVEKKLLAPGSRDEIIEGLQDREAVTSTAIGHAVAVPHCYLDSIIEPTVVFVQLKDALNLGAPDRIATRYFFILLGPKSATAAHLDTLALIARLMSDDEFRYDLSNAHEKEDLAGAMERSLQRSSAVPTSDKEKEVSDGLKFSGRFCGGIIDDIKRRWPVYKQDFKDGLHPKSLASILFLFFACLAPTVTFGGVMSVETNGEIGTVEMILATAICSVVYAIVAGQPMIILGGTGPMLVFTIILYELCGQYEVEFLPAYWWIGFWTMLFVLLLAATDVGCLMRYFSRFTIEIFAALISMIFIYKAIESLVVIFQDLDAKQHHDTALLSLILALGTFYVATTLQSFRRSRYMVAWMREFLADFGPAIALAAMTLVAFLLHEVYLDVLPAPDQLGTTNGRSWFVNPLDAPGWVRWAAMGPAFFGAILVYLDQNITARLVNSPDHHMQRGASYHWDLAVIGMLVGICSMFGLPWLVAATVRSLNHVRSLATTEEVVNMYGERKDKILHVRENRVTALAIHLMIGVSLLFLPLLKLIPMAVLYGLFLFMGIVSMRGNQFFERISLWFMETSLYPSTHYIRRVPLWTVHGFTAIQLVCLVVLWVVKESPYGILFPLFIALLVPIRFVLPYLAFNRAYLRALDAEEVPEGTELPG